MFKKVNLKRELLSIRTQLLVILILIAIIPLIIIVNFVINRIFIHLEKQSRNYYYTIINQVANNLNFVYNQYARTLSNMIEIPEVVKGLSSPPYRSKEEERLISNNIIGDVNTRGGLRNTVEEKIEGAVFIYEMDRKSLLNEKNYKIHYVSSSNIAPTLEEIVNDPIFLSLKENKDKLVLGSFKNYKFSDGKQRAIIIFPYYQSEGIFTKFILITLFPDFIPKFYTGIENLKYGTLYILDRYNNILSKNHPSEDDLYNYDYEKKRYILEEGDSKIYDDISFNDYLVLNTDENILKTQIITEMLEKIDTEEINEELLKQKYYITYNNIKYLVVFGSEYSTKCKFVYFHPIIQIQRPIYNIVFIIIIITVFIIGIVITISLILSKTFTNPIMQLSEASLQISKGDYNISINIIKSNKEVNSLVETFNKMVKEIKNYTENLEKLVSERTQELKDAHEKLQLAHKALWGEMELAKKIQVSLLPISPSIKGYDISAKMIAAIEVGGDFYDIINYDTNNIIIIGDVSGHGVTPGLITMIVQTIVSSILTQNKSIPLKELYNYLNIILIEKIKKLNMRIYVTISILKETGNGNFVGCGKHNDIIIYRKEKKEIELIETRGIWLGILEDISNYIQEYSFKLNKDDVMLLYTDGLSEVSTPEGVMFSEKLKEILLKISNKNADEILSNIFYEFENFKNGNYSESNIDDDITLLVIKKIR